MGLTEYALSQALYLAINHVDHSGLVTKTAGEFDKLTDERLGLKGSEKLQSQIVEKILIPLSRELLKENQDGFRRILIEEFKSLGGGQLISGSLGPIPGAVGPKIPAQNFVPKICSGPLHDG